MLATRTLSNNGSRNYFTMAGDSLHCIVCRNVITSKTNCNVVPNYLWNYIYHKNVRECLTGGGGGVPEDNAAPQSIPTLTFTFDVGEGSGSVSSGGASEAGVCGDCTVELRKLDKLHQQLESLKKSIESQVEEINKRCISGTPKAQRNEEGSCLLQKHARKLQMTMSGSVIGKENISHTLKFLGNLCKEVDCSEPSAPAPLVQTKIDDKINYDDISTNLETAAGLTNYIAPHSSRSIVSSIHEGGITLPADCEYFSTTATKMESESVFMEAEVADTAIVTAVVKPEFEETEETNILYDTTSIPESDFREVSENNIFLDMDETPGEPEMYAIQQDPLDITEHDNCPISGTSRNRKRKVKSPPKRKVRRQRAPAPKNGTGSAYISYECRVCHKAFTRKQGADRHEMMHSGERPWACEHCPSRFYRRYLLANHYTKVHKIPGAHGPKK